MGRVMLDIRRIRENPDELRTALRNRGQEPAVVDEVLSIDAEWRALKVSVDEKRAEKNKATHEVAKAHDEPSAGVQRRA